MNKPYKELETEFLDYLNYQFPATRGHNPLKEKIAEIYNAGQNLKYVLSSNYGFLVIEPDGYAKVYHVQDINNATKFSLESALENKSNDNNIVLYL